MDGVWCLPGELEGRHHLERFRELYDRSLPGTNCPKGVHDEERCGEDRPAGRSVRPSRPRFRERIKEVAEVGRWHPSWLVPIWIVEAVERFVRLEAAPLGDLYPQYLSADGGPHTDTFMAWPGRASSITAATALHRARTALRIIDQQASDLPDQPLGVHLVRERGWLVATELPSDGRAIAFLGPRGPVLAPEAAKDDELLPALERIAAGGELVAPLLPVPHGHATPSLVCVSLGPTPLSVARHIHRAAWTRHGGPWLGLGFGDGYDIASTCHLAIDGYGHGRLVGALQRAFVAEDPVAREPAFIAVTLPSEEPIGVATTRLPRSPSFPQLAYAFGVALLEVYGPRGRFTPTFQVPIAPGAAEERRLGRVIHALLSLRCSPSGELETFDDFRQRLRPALTREIAGDGVLTRFLAATLRIPVPRPLVRRLLATPGRPSRMLPPIEAFGGRGRLSSIRFAEGDAPVDGTIAASAPALRATSNDPRGGVVFTVLHTRGGVTATIAGTGFAGDESGAQELLDAIVVRVDSLDR